VDLPAPSGAGLAATALDAVVTSDSSLWRIESIFDGLGGTRPRDRRNSLPASSERTRVALTFNAATGHLAPGQPILIWQERQWALEPSAELTVREPKENGLYDATDGTGLERSGIGAAFVSGAIGIDCFGETKIAKMPPVLPEFSASGVTRLALAGGIEVRSAPDFLEVACCGAGGRQNLVRTNFDAVHSKCCADVRLVDEASL